MTPAEEIREERICLVAEGCGISYEEAEKIVDREQMELFERIER